MTVLGRFQRRALHRFPPQLLGVTLVAGLAVAPLPPQSLVPMSATTTVNTSVSNDAVLRPDGDVNRQWTGGTAGSAAAALDDLVVAPNPVSAQDYIYAAGAGRRTEVTLSTSNMVGGEGTVTAWFYANTGVRTTLRVEVVQANTVLASTTVEA